MRSLKPQNLAAPQFSASLVVNRTNQMKQFEAVAFQRVFDTVSLGKGITGSPQTFREWIKNSLDEGIQIAIERTHKSTNTLEDNGLKLNISINGSPYQERIIVQPYIQFMDNRRLLYRPQTDRTLLSWGKNLQNSLSKLNAALVDTFGWAYKGAISKDKKALTKFYTALNTLPENQVILRQKPNVQDFAPTLQPAPVSPKALRQKVS